MQKRRCRVKARQYIYFLDCLSLAATNGLASQGRVKAMEWEEESPIK